MIKEIIESLSDSEIIGLSRPDLIETCYVMSAAVIREHGIDPWPDTLAAIACLAPKDRANVLGWLVVMTYQVGQNFYKPRRHLGLTPFISPDAKLLPIEMAHRYIESAVNLVRGVEPVKSRMIIMSLLRINLVVTGGAAGVKNYHSLQCSKILALAADTYPLVTVSFIRAVGRLEHQFYTMVCRYLLGVGIEPVFKIGCVMMLQLDLLLRAYEWQGDAMLLGLCRTSDALLLETDLVVAAGDVPPLARDAYQTIKEVAYECENS
ncbi:MAG: hypothetical protein KAG66_08885 [Methylococcales bacterium]|nr:hypothetical protein [Methylococcales bacterium]